MNPVPAASGPKIDDRPARMRNSIPPARPRAVRAMLASEARLLAREPAVVVWAALLPIAAMIVLSVLPATREAQAELGGTSFVELYLPIIMLFAITMMALQSRPVTLVSYRELGVLRRLRTTPASPWLLLGTNAVLTIAVSLVICAVLVAIPAIAGPGLPENLGGFALAVVLAILAISGLGALISALVPNARITGAVGWVASAIVWFAAGMWMPRPFFPDWLTVVADATPGGAAASALLDSAGGAWPGLWPVVVLIVWTLGTFAIAVRAFRFE